MLRNLRLSVSLAAAAMVTACAAGGDAFDGVEGRSTCHTQDGRYVMQPTCSVTYSTSRTTETTTTTTTTTTEPAETDDRR